MKNYEFDVIAIGRSSVDLYGQQIGGRLEDMSSFAKYIGGSPANTSIGVSRLGLRSAMITGVGDEHMGRFIQEQLIRENVDIRGVKIFSDRLSALVLLGIRNKEQFPLIFYRENCADMALSEDDIDEDFIKSSKCILLSGTHFSTEDVSAMSKKAAAICRESGGQVAFDIDYRPNLWGIGGHGEGEERFASNNKITAHLQTILPLCDLIVGTEEEIHIAGGSVDTMNAIRNIRTYSDATIVCKLGAMGCVVFPDAIPDNIEDGIRGLGFEVEIFNVLGAGDAFMSGFLRGWIKNEPLENCAKFANACGAFAVSRHGCAPAMPTWIELQHFLNNGSQHLALRDDITLNHLHWATTRRKEQNMILGLAIDHRAQFEDMAGKSKDSLAHIGDFKKLALQALRSVADGKTGFGILLDDRFGRDALHSAMDGDLWVGRPVELPGSRPLEFETGLDIGSELIEWPIDQAVKCLVFYHPDDADDLKYQQEQKVIQLSDACRNTGHELLLEIICGNHGDMKIDTVARVLSRFYDLGVRPDWWKLEPLDDKQSWQKICDVINQNDPYCRGIVLLGLDATIDKLLSVFNIAVQYKLVKGFTIGRSVFGDIAKSWFNGKIDDDAARIKMATGFSILVNAWLNSQLNHTSQKENAK